MQMDIIEVNITKNVSSSDKEQGTGGSNLNYTATIQKPCYTVEDKWICEIKMIFGYVVHSYSLVPDVGVYYNIL